MKPSQMSYGFLTAFLAALFLLRFWPVPSYPLPLLFTLGAVAGLSIALLCFVPQSRSVCGMVLAMSIGILGAFLSASGAFHETTPNDIEAYARGESVEVHGWVILPADVRPTVTKLTVAVDRLRDEEGDHVVEGRILTNAYGGLWPPLQYGDEVLVTGKLTRPEQIDDFDYPHYLELSKVRALITRGKIAPANEGRKPPASARTWTALRLLTDLRTAVEDRIGLILPEPHASLEAGLLTGTRRGLPAHVSDDFRISGITHIIAVSGFNVTIVLTLLGGLLFWIPVKKRLIPQGIAAVLFCVFVGGGAPVVRATIMGILGLVALSAERIPTTRLLILWTAFLMVALKPLTLWYDASFQLSFLAVIGLSELSTPLKKLFRAVPETLAIRESLTATVAAQITTIPLSILLFKQFSLIAPVTNILVAPLIPLSMLLGTIATLLSLVWMPLGLVAGYGTWLLLECIMRIAQLCAMAPFASIQF